MRHYRSRASTHLIILLLGTCLWPIISESIPSRNKSNLKREPGAIYLEDFSKEKVELLAIKQDPIYVSSQRKRAIGQLRRGKKVTLIAITDKQYLIRGMALHGQVKGWILPSALQGLDKNFSDKLRTLYERKKIVDELIKNKQIALGMNTDEVVTSMGKPSRKTLNLIVTDDQTLTNTLRMSALLSIGSDAILRETCSVRNITLKWKLVSSL